jgi:hypothetical protein
MTTLENTRMDTLRHEWSKLARYRFLALHTKEAWNSLYFHKVGKHSHMTSVQLDNYKKRDDNSVINRWHFFPESLVLRAHYIYICLHFSLQGILYNSQMQEKYLVTRSTRRRPDFHVDAFDPPCPSHGRHQLLLGRGQEELKDVCAVERGPGKVFRCRIH